MKGMIKNAVMYKDALFFVFVIVLPAIVPVFF